MEIELTISAGAEAEVVDVKREEEAEETAPEE
jgi:hypothetical protein